MPQSTTSGPAYFGSWASKQLPFQPLEPISEAEARSRPAYYVAHYDEQGQLVRFEKYLAQARQWSDEYQYWDNGKLRSRHMIKADGTEIRQDFDRKGHVMKP